MQAHHIESLRKDFCVIAKEKVDVEELSETVYAFGSELACLRLFAKYNGNGSTVNSKYKVGFSSNRKIWYFCFEMRF